MGASRGIAFLAGSSAVRKVETFIFAAILAGGQVPIEDYPGLAKTSAARCLAKALGLSFRRVQFTEAMQEKTDYCGGNHLFPSQSFGPGKFGQRYRRRNSCIHACAESIDMIGPKARLEFLAFLVPLVLGLALRHRGFLVLAIPLA